MCPTDYGGFNSTDHRDDIAGTWITEIMIILFINCSSMRIINVSVSIKYYNNMVTMDERKMDNSMGFTIHQLAET